jgi:hypothetical protein
MIELANWTEWLMKLSRSTAEVAPVSYEAFRESQILGSL